MSTPSYLVTAGSMASRAVMPGMSPIDPMRPRVTNHQKFRPHIISTTGSSATESAEMTSEMMETLRRLTRSRMAPPATPMISCGTEQMSASAPAARASPVVASKMSGSATPATELPSSDSAFDARNRTVAWVFFTSFLPLCSRGK